MSDPNSGHGTPPGSGAPGSDPRAIPAATPFERSGGTLPMQPRPPEAALPFTSAPTPKQPPRQLDSPGILSGTIATPALAPAPAPPPASAPAPAPPPTPAPAPAPALAPAPEPAPAPSPDAGPSPWTSPQTFNADVLPSANILQPVSPDPPAPAPSTPITTAHGSRAMTIGLAVAALLLVGTVLAFLLTDDPAEDDPTRVDVGAEQRDYGDAPPAPVTASATAAPKPPPKPAVKPPPAKPAQPEDIYDDL